MWNYNIFKHSSKIVKNNKCNEKASYKMLMALSYYNIKKNDKIY